MTTEPKTWGDRARKERAAIRDAEERQRRQDMTDEREIEYYTNEAKLGLED